MVWEIEHYMPLEEFDSWIAWFKLKSEAQKRELEKARSGSGAASPARSSGSPRSRTRH